MSHDDFNVLLERRLNLIRAVLARKAGEYATDADRLHNFKAAADITRETAAEAALGMWVKHVVSVVDIIKSGKRPSRELVDEKFGDAINYLVLLEALLVEE